MALDNASAIVGQVVDLLLQIVDVLDERSSPLGRERGLASVVLQASTRPGEVLPSAIEIVVSESTRCTVATDQGMLCLDNVSRLAGSCSASSRARGTN
ncbi:MAG TPA: hypothetical protein PLB92_12890, partial [Rhodoglobus sp.]|nr:hypothetical protein [Rhodoglobus sp.]